jgi:hypothetical protein
MSMQTVNCRQMQDEYDEELAPKRIRCSYAVISLVGLVWPSIHQGLRSQKQFAVLFAVKFADLSLNSEKQ